MTTYATATAYAIEKNLIAADEKVIGIVAEAIDERGPDRFEIHEILPKVHIAFLWVVPGPESAVSVMIMTTQLGEIVTYKTAGAALEAVKIDIYGDVLIKVVKHPLVFVEPTKKMQAVAWKAKFAEQIKSFGNTAVVAARIEATTPSSVPGLIEMLDRQRAVVAWSNYLRRNIEILANALAAQGVDAQTLIA